MATVQETLTLGWEAHQAGDTDVAEAKYREALRVEPGSANAWCYLGMVCHDTGRFADAEAAYQKAIVIQSDFAVAHNNLGNSLSAQGRTDDALASYRRAVEIKPDYANAFSNMAKALILAGELDEAMANLERVLRTEPDHAEAHKNFAVLLLLHGDFERGWPEYEWRWQTRGVSLPPLTQPRWDGSPLAKRSIMLYAEQGLGDTIQFVRYASLLKEQGADVTFASQGPLLSLLRTCRGIDTLLARDEPLPATDVYAPLMSLPGILGHTLDDFPSNVPYLSADPKLVPHWERRLKPIEAFKIGIVWQGNPKHELDRLRSIPLERFAPLGDLRGVQLVSLQRGAGVEQLEAVGDRLPVIDLGRELDEKTGAFMDTAAVMTQLDLVITADTAAAHLGGALGVPVWLALCMVPDWRWQLDGETTPWYPTMRLFRQTKPGDWQAVFQRIAQEVEVLVSGREPAGDRPRQAIGEAEATGPEHRIATTGFNCLNRSRHGLMLYNRHDIYIGRSLDRYGEFSEAEIEVLRQVVEPGDIVVEAGASVGAHTLAFANLVGAHGAVHAFEPQRIVFQTLCANMALNSVVNVHCRQAALGDREAHIIVPVLDYDKENNFGGLGLGSYEHGEKVPVVTVDSLQLPRCKLLKADVEGMELEVLKGAVTTIRAHTPVLYVENDRPERSGPLIEYVASLGYNMFWHTPPLFSSQNYFGNTENVFGNLISANMLCIHSSVASSIQGLRPVDGLHPTGGLARRLRPQG